jgi:hypothetical protein
MNTARISVFGSIGAVVATLLGVAFFFMIIGVLGLSVSIAALMLFLALAVFIFRRPQDQEARP